MRVRNTMEPDTHGLTDDSDPVPSRAEMAANRLAEEVIARRTALGMKRDALRRAAGMSRKTLRSIEEANPSRSYGSDTLGKLDGPLGWNQGHAYRIWREEPGPDVAELLGELRSLTEERTADVIRLVTRLLEQPVWAAELVDACRLLDAEDRARVLDFARRLSR